MLVQNIVVDKQLAGRGCGFPKTLADEVIVDAVPNVGVLESHAEALEELRSGK